MQQSGLEDEAIQNADSITFWSVDRVSKYIDAIGFSTYCRTFEENEISGNVLVHLDHDALRDMGIDSIGHRLIILKSVYKTKLQDGIWFDSGDYVPATSVESDHGASKESADTLNMTACFRLRDQRIQTVESDMKKLFESFYRLREDLLPVFKIVKDAKPLPMPESQSLNGSAYSATVPNLLNGVQSDPSPRLSTFAFNKERPNSETRSADSRSMSAETKGDAKPSSQNSLSRRQSNKRLVLNPSARSTSPLMSQNGWSAERPPPNLPLPPPPTPNPVEVFKSFRLTRDDPCYKVLPAALKRYKVADDWRKYAMFICYGDQERCLGMEEKPLAVFHQLQNDGKNPVFMVRHVDGGKLNIGGTPGGVL